jgi:hypothetical protein
MKKEKFRDQDSKNQDSSTNKSDDSQSMEKQMDQWNKILKNTIKISVNDVFKSMMKEELKITKKIGVSSSCLLKGMIKDTPIFGKAYYNSIPESLNEECSDELGLLYEKMIYQEIIPMISLYSPNFLQPICMMSITPKDLNSIGKRSYFKKIKESIPISEDCKPNNSIGIIFTQLIQHKTLNEFMRYKTFSEEDFQKIIAQIILSLAVMSMYNLAHNDLHDDNVMIEKLKQPEDFQYFFEKEKVKKFITIPEVKYKVYIFDWDFSYYQPFGDNLKTELGEFCNNSGICNRYDQLYDIYNILCYCYNWELNNIKNFDSFMEDITGKSKNEIIEIYRKLVLYNYRCHLPYENVKEKKRSRNEIFGNKIFVDQNLPAFDMFQKIIEHPYIESILKK